jgi:hypothetical protein
MCVIVDTNQCHKALRVPCYADYDPLFSWINDRDGKLVYGGKLAVEMARDSKTMRLLLQWGRAGKAIRFLDKDLVEEEARISNSGEMVSDDPHNLALAVVSKTRLLCTDDRNLQRDFKNRLLVPMAHCRIYQNSDHQDLLKHTPGCKGYAAARQHRTKKGKRR